MCLKTHTTAMGFCLARGPGGEGLAYLHPNALTASWELKQGAPLKSPDSRHTWYISGILSGAMAASNPWCNSWGGQLLSISASCQVGVLSGYSHKRVARWAHAAVQKAYGASPHVAEKTTGLVHQNIKHSPRPRCCHVAAVLAWLKTCFLERGPIFLMVSSREVTGCWCDDVPALLKLWRVRSESCSAFKHTRPAPTSPPSEVLVSMFVCV